MELLHAIHTRRSIRDFREDSVSLEQLNQLVDAAVYAPSAVNRQPWHFTVVRDRILLNAISAQSKRLLLAAIEKGSAPAVFRDHLRNPDFHIFYNAPCLIVISAARDDAWCVEDVTLAAENLMLAACASGLGTCWISFAQRYLETEEGRASIGLPADFRPVAPIIVGHPRAFVAAPERKPALIRWIG